jgi:predicted nucleic acid-binding protein
MHSEHPKRHHSDLSKRRSANARPNQTAELVADYRDLPLGTVDASVIAAAERLDAAEVATLDRRHCSVVRPRHEVAFQLLP